MKNQRLGFVGLEHDTASACLSMLKIMDGRSGVHWSESEPDAADVLMISSEATAETQRWSSSTKPRIVVYPAGEAKPTSAFTLAHPFRVMQLIGVLEEVAESLSGVASGDSQAEPESSLELFWESLHK